MTHNHCIHGVEIDGYCPACVIDVSTIEGWLGCPLSTDVRDFGALLHDFI